MPYLSDVNLRAILAVLVRRAGGEVHVSNEDMYGAMMPASGTAEPFIVAETSTGLRISIDDRGESSRDGDGDAHEAGGSCSTEP